MKRKIVSLLLVLCFVYALIPSAVLAAGTSKEYSDVDQSKWYVPYIDYVVEHNLMVGTGRTKFSPNGYVTRAQYVQTLYALAQKPTVKKEAVFSDLKKGAFYVDAVNWAAEVGITSGMTKTTFAPNQRVTREQAATFFKAYAENVANKKTNDNSILTSFPDFAKVSKYATSAMEWAVGAKLITGVKQGKTILLDPKGVLSRAQLATMLQAFNNYLEKKSSIPNVSPSQEPSSSPSLEPTTNPGTSPSKTEDGENDIAKPDENVDSEAENVLDEVKSDISENGKYPVDEVRVQYTLKKETGYVDIEKIERTSYLSRTPGVVSCPIEITAVADTVTSADIIFHVDSKSLGDIDLENLGIVWFDDDNNKSVLLENTEIDYENNTISAHTSHFSKYVVVNTIDWYDAWAMEQLVPRTMTSGNTENGALYNVIFALDSSGSMQNNMDLLKKATASFIGLLDEKDKYSIVTFSTDADIVVKSKMRGVGSYSEVFHSAYDALQDVYSDGLTNYEKGLSTALSLIIEGQEEEDQSGGYGRQALLVYLSDGEPTTYYTRETLDLLRFLADTAGCRCVTVGLGNGVNEYYLKEMASCGNGTYRHVSNASELNDLFESINGWYIGSTQDTDGDGIPDIVEKTGMRTNYGFIVKTDPNLPDTDGDGIPDGEEIGAFIQTIDNVSSYFEIKSDPTITTNMVDTAKLKVVSAGLVPDISAFSNLTTVSNDNFQTIVDKVNNYSIVYNVKAIGIEQAGDFLTETAYKRDPVFRDSISVNESCGKKTQVGTSKTIKRNSNESGKMAMTCSNGLINCRNEHRYDIDIKCENGSTDWSEAVITNLNASEIWKSVATKYIDTVKKDYSSQADDFKTNCETMVNLIDSAYTSAVNEDKTKIKEKLGINYTLQTITGTGTYNNGDTNEDIEEAFFDYFIDRLQQNLDDHKSTYKNTKTTTELVNSISKSIFSDSDTFTIKTKNFEYTVDLTMTGTSLFGGATLSEATISGGAYSGKFVATTASDQNIENEISELYRFANEKMDNAVKQAKSEIKSASLSMIPADVQKSFQALLKNKAFDLLNSKSAGLGDKLNKAIEMAKKFGDLRKSYSAIKNIDLNRKEPSTIISSVTSYTSKLEAWKSAVNSFIN